MHFVQIQTSSNIHTYGIEGSIDDDDDDDESQSRLIEIPTNTNTNTNNHIYLLSSLAPTWEPKETGQAGSCFSTFIS